MCYFLIYIISHVLFLRVKVEYTLKIISTRARLYIAVSVKAVCFYPNKLRLLHDVLLDLCDF